MLIGATIVITTKIAAVTDVDGEFILKVPRSYQDSTAILKVNFIGFVPIERELVITEHTDSTSLVFQLKLDPRHEFVSVVAGGAYYPSFWQRLKYRIRSWFSKKSSF